LDSTQEDAFGERGSSQTREIERAIAEGCKEFGLIEALAKLGEEMRGRGPEIHIFDKA
jgi:hypothetical protein